MKRKKSNTHLWRVLAAVNVLALIYPINLMHGAESADETLFAAFALIGVVFLLITVDAVSIVVASAVGSGKF
jgi:hypothetical protein